MPSAFAHAAVALAATGALVGRRGPKRLWLTAVACSTVPDLDVIGFGFGIAYGDLLGHRGLSHSLAFAVVLGATVTALGFRRPEHRPVTAPALALFFAAITASHGLLDAMTNGGLGIGLLSPFDATRYFFPWRPIAVSPLSPASFFSPRGLSILANEGVYVALPALLAMLAIRRALRARNA